MSLEFSKNDREMSVPILRRIAQLGAPPALERAWRFLTAPSNVRRLELSCEAVFTQLCEEFDADELIAARIAK